MSRREYDVAAQEVADLQAQGKYWPNLDELMWRAIKSRLGVTNFAEVPWGQCWGVAREMGFPLSKEQQEQRDAWINTQPAKAIQ